ncbi:MAG TPA: 12,18-didecarboxysiroheme deacetylase [Syntrophorhabdaceae bacterium]|jgi:12,18-didecarboxysiroheme deacetylase|nr:12,18-didecarboxysiroheme deacetylase [Syntrophorhabdaceae bacterium]MDI9562105.1 12,18-didecarboxysiroheme deacetylase [Pseudomonadota bacterium]OQC47737.1 MAG: Antilisterial bacteriocin subtilosin biosynthesis protein AlbA [Deltaproteobacteria bacterium ADurb.Bin026]MBP8698957.1 12,18-didecarboxysiroheme deacetylase [Syntrophorhabdaceae bacterium]MBV6505581.1 putative mycofactocin radical SAM maturase MftC [Syntrophorhabdaceae bacterium]
MIGISKLYCGAVEASDPLRYGRESRRLPSHLLQFSSDKKPVVVWNMTKRCNLRCIHCYARAENETYRGNELSTDEGKRLIDDLAEFGVPVILFSGGEPVLRKDLPDLIDYAVKKGLRAVISTNGTLITEEKAKQFARYALSYIGISIDGTGKVNDAFRGVDGAYDLAINGVRNAKHAGIKVGLRFTINKKNYNEIQRIFDIIETEGIQRVCFYHLVYAGRGSQLINEDISHEESRKVVDYIMDRTKESFKKGSPIEVLTVDNHADGPYVYLRLLQEDSQRAKEVYDLLMMNEGNASGVGIACVDEEGNVHADQFWRHYSFGNVRSRPFSEIWTDTGNELMAKLKEKKRHVKGRCARCRWLDICGGNFRVRAEAATGDIWAEDPQCYLTEEEIRPEGL